MRLEKMPNLEALLIGDYPPPAGGIATHVSALNEFLRAQEVKVRVLDIGRGKNFQENIQGRTPWGALAEIQNWGTSQSVLHFHTSGNNSKSWLLTFLIGLSPCRAKKIVTFHSGLLPQYLSTHPAVAQNLASALTGFDEIVTVSEVQHQALQKACTSRLPLQVISPFIANLKTGRFPQNLWKRMQGQFPILTVIYHPSPVYGFDIATDATLCLKKSFPNLLLVVLGSHTDAEKRLPRELKSNALLTGELSLTEAMAVFQASDVFIRPTTTDGDSLSVREALSLQVRCVASDAAARPEGTIVFETGNAQSLARAVVHALEKEAPHVAMPHGGVEILSLYQKIVGC